MDVHARAAARELRDGIHSISNPGGTHGDGFPYPGRGYVETGTPLPRTHVAGSDDIGDIFRDGASDRIVQKRKRRAAGTTPPEDPNTHVHQGRIRPSFALPNDISGAPVDSRDEVGSQAFSDVYDTGIGSEPTRSIESQATYGKARHRVDVQMPYLRIGVAIVDDKLLGGEFRLRCQLLRDDPHDAAARYALPVV